MNIYETLPPASPRVGFYRVVSAWTDAAMVEFGPEGTMHYTQGNIKGDTSNLFTTGMKEHQIIFGDTTNLEKAILDIDRLKKPELLFVVSSPVSEIIGTDLRIICRRMQQKTHAKLSVWENVPVTGREEAGSAQAYHMAAQFLKESPQITFSKKREGFLVLGLGEGDWNGLADLEELRRMMDDYFQIPCLNHRDGRYGLQDLKNAQILIAAAPESIVLAETVNQLYGIPYCAGLPYGLSATVNLIDSVAKIVGMTPSMRWNCDRREVEAAISQFRTAIRSIMKRRIYLDARGAREDDWNYLLTAELGLNVIFPEKCSPALSTDGSVGFSPSIEDGDILMGCGMLCSLYPTHPSVCIEYPVTDQKCFGRYKPFVGLRGVLNLMDLIYTFLKTA